MNTKVLLSTKNRDISSRKEMLIFAVKLRVVLIASNIEDFKFHGKTEKSNKNKFIAAPYSAPRFIPKINYLW